MVDGKWQDIGQLWVRALPGEADGASAADADRAASTPPEGVLPSLTRRQREVAVLIGLGLDDPHIAEVLDLTPGTVADHVEHIQQRLALASRAQIRQWAIRHGLTEPQDRLLTLLERLLEIEAPGLDAALDQAAQVIVEALGTDKVDVFMHEAETDSLVAHGASQTPLGRKQRAIGLNRQPLANGGRTAEVFLTGQPHLSGHADQDPLELVGITRGLGIRSQVLVPLLVAGERRGVLAAQSAVPDTFSERDLRFLRAVARWVGGLVQRAELLERTAAAAAEQGRRAAADELVMVVAHDLRNHLVPLRARAGMIRRHGARGADTQLVRQAEALEEAMARLEAMIADLLDVARLEHGLFALVVRETDLAALVRDTAGRFRTEQSEVRVRAPEQLRGGVDPDRARQALENLLANAVQHAPAGTPVEVTLATEPRGDGTVALISVGDHGPGLPPELLPHVFERFATGARSTGLGLGLYLAHRVAAAHGGALDVQSTPGRGTCFTLTLPIGPASQATDHRCPAP